MSVQNGVGATSSSDRSWTTAGKNNECSGIRDVWANNLEEEFHLVRQVVKRYPFIAMVSRKSSVLQTLPATDESTVQLSFDFKSKAKQTELTCYILKIRVVR